MLGGGCVFFVVRSMTGASIGVFAFSNDDADGC